MSAFTGSKTGDVFVLWAPYLYVALSRGGQGAGQWPVGGGRSAGALVAHPRFARERPELVTRFLRVYLRGLEWQRQNRAAALDILARFNEQASLKLDKRWFDEAFKTRPVWGVAGQLGLLARKEGQPSVAE